MLIAAAPKEIEKKSEERGATRNESMKESAIFLPRV